MKLHEVIQELLCRKDEYLWFRPVSWKGNGAGYYIQGGNTYLVPTSRGGAMIMTSCASTLIQEWEIVTPDEVLDGL